MRIVIDLQGAQTTSSRDRGIGRYSLALSKALAKLRASHEIIIALNGAFPETIEPIRQAFDGLLPPENIVVWNALRPVNGFDESSANRKYISELVREAFFESLNPDIVHLSSLFEGFDDDAVHSIGLHSRNYITSLNFYDLIPLLQSNIYLDPNPLFKKLYFEKIEYLKSADIFLAISESSRQELIGVLSVVPDRVRNIGAGVSDIFQKLQVSTQDEKNLRSKFGISAKFIMYSGAADERKNHRGLMQAYDKLSPSLKSQYQLVFVGKLPIVLKDQLRTYAASLGFTERDVVITDKVSDDELVAFYNLCDLFVFPSWHEGFGLPALEALACGAPVIGSNNTSIPEVIGREDALFNPHDPIDIAQKIEQILLDPLLSADLRGYGPYQAKNFSWEKSAQKTLAFFEHWYEQGLYEKLNGDKKPLTMNRPDWLLPAIKDSLKLEEGSSDWNLLNKVLKQNHFKREHKMIFVDVSELMHRDQNTGIQRVVRSILHELLTQGVEGYKVVPVHANTETLGYRYANQFKARFLKQDPLTAEDEFIQFQSGDIFFGLDVQFAVIPAQESFYRELRGHGVKIVFMIYDLLPILSPQFFEGGVLEFYEKWLLTIARVSDGVVCISKAVADEFIEWVDSKSPARLTPLMVGWSHIGADLESSVPTFGLPENAHSTLEVLKENTSFLSVGTLEPRKGHLQMLEAFELLWTKGFQGNLVFVGKEGWNIEELKHHILSSKYMGKKLFWLAGISDEYLEEVYKASSCLIMASQGEGFGLPIVEGAQRGLPMIVRDIPVFREVAGLYASYFSGLKGLDLALAIEKWLDEDSKGCTIQSKEMPWLSWSQSTNNLLEIILAQKWYFAWQKNC
ncbi:glycosyltransferase family 4 protein [Polynucleobacter paneuropaeus]|nr:glycosyltransferase family 4 protein [Polynucleobacter paneuropaeus]